MELDETVANFSDGELPPGCVLMAREERHPEAFGVAVLDDDGNLIDIVEKPEHPPSNLAIGGIYLFDERFWTYLDQAESMHGINTSISDVNRIYVNDKEAKLISVGEETWVDCGTPETLLKASMMAKEGKLDPTPHR